MLRQRCWTSPERRISVFCLCLQVFIRYAGNALKLFYLINLIWFTLWSVTTHLSCWLPSLPGFTGIFWAVSQKALNNWGWAFLLKLILIIDDWSRQAFKTAPWGRSAHYSVGYLMSISVRQKNGNCLLNSLCKLRCALADYDSYGNKRG